MKTMKSFLLAILASCSLVCGQSRAAETYDARIKEKEILTPVPAQAPRINGPKVYGARPAKQFIYRIPTQGERPVQFAVQGLPEGLKLDAAKGIITGKTPDQKGDYAMIFTAKNGHGEIARPFKLVVGEKLALTPPTGWNSWGGQMKSVTDRSIRLAADIFEQRGLADVGYQYVGIDDCWMCLDPSQYEQSKKQGKTKRDNRDAGIDFSPMLGTVRDYEGNIIPNSLFPDMKALTDYIHAYGLKAGLYSSPGRLTCQGFAGSQGFEQKDAEQYARWGFDLLKYDQCSAGGPIAAKKKENPGYQVKEFWRPMASFLQATDRDFLFNLCQYGQDKPWIWAPELGMQTWRTGGDLNHHLETYFKQALRIATELRDYNKPGQWNDPDFMYIHYLRDAFAKGKPAAEIKLDTNQRYQYVTLWAIVCAPFFFSCDVAKIDEFTIRLLANADVVNINQDELGHTAEVLRNDDNKETVMVKKLADGSKVLAVFNRDPKNEAMIAVQWAELGISGNPQVFDIWRQKKLGAVATSLAVQLSPNGVGLFVLAK